KGLDERQRIDDHAEDRPLPLDPIECQRALELHGGMDDHAATKAGHDGGVVAQPGHSGVTEERAEAIRDQPVELRANVCMGLDERRGLRTPRRRSEALWPGGHGVFPRESGEFRAGASWALACRGSSVSTTPGKVYPQSLGFS